MTNNFKISSQNHSKISNNKVAKLINIISVMKYNVNAGIGNSQDAL